ncbi:hypothetical protein B0H13DRAFT_1871270 [Mycena leptocephala]|nr:hypothetical protein B0H13DRAFT_1871270 [Mycena leptocephala]
MAAVNLTDADITTVLTNASQVVGTFYRDVVTRFPTKKPSELGMTDLFTKEIGCHPLHGRAFHAKGYSLWFQSFTSAIDDDTDMRENEHGADFILSFGRAHDDGEMQVETQYQIYIQAKKVKVDNGHEEVDFYYQYVHSKIMDSEVDLNSFSLRSTSRQNFGLSTGTGFNGQPHSQAGLLEASSTGVAADGSVNAGFYVVYKNNGTCIIPIHALYARMHQAGQVQTNRAVWGWANARYQHPAADFLAVLEVGNVSPRCEVEMQLTLKNPYEEITRNIVQIVGVLASIPQISNE